mmetsp:Transcript_28139/g.67082  ORF Transcript_28139/g.67082 Transcript_28139/m.67082 type:complete len:120 (-) Transcript_28139:137-496(-)
MTKTRRVGLIYDDMTLRSLRSTAPKIAASEEMGLPFDSDLKLNWNPSTKGNPTTLPNNLNREVNAKQLMLFWTSDNVTGLAKRGGEQQDLRDSSEGLGPLSRLSRPGPLLLVTQDMPKK